MDLKFVGFYKGSGWKCEMAFYQWRCPKCGKLVVDYKHGFEDNENGEYVICSACGGVIHV